MKNILHPYIRGGSWYYSSDVVRCAFRDWHPPYDRINNLGFRLVSNPRVVNKTITCIKGGSWLNSSDDVRSSFRVRSHPNNRYDSLGFRLIVKK